METLQYPTKTTAIKEHKCDFCTGVILKKDVYWKSTYKYDGIIYTWKTHQDCADIANRLNMYDNDGEGVSTEDFIENIKCEYQKIMSDSYTEIYEDKSFVYPKFNEQLSFVIKHNLRN